MPFPVSRSLIATGIPVAAAALLYAGFAVAQTPSQQGGQVAPARPTFCIANNLDGAPITAEIKAGKAATKVQLPAGQNGCCVKFCNENPAPSGYQISIQAQPAGGAAREICKSKVTAGQVLRITGSAAQASCATSKL